MGWNWLCAIFIASNLIPNSDSACTFPSIFSGAWWDSDRGVLTFGSESISGLVLTIYGTDMQNWDCWQVDGFQGQNFGGTIIIKSRESLFALGVNFDVYICFNLTRISDYSFYYYQMYDRQNNANNERVFVTNVKEGDLKKSMICKNQLDPGFDADFKLLLKEGSELEARQELPVQLLGNFEYTFIDTSGSYCNNPVGMMETCGDKKTMVFDYTKCSKEIANSRFGNLSCVATLQKGSYIFVMMYNSETSESLHRFTCFVISSDGTSASYAYKNCSRNQSPYTSSLASDGGSAAGKLSLKIIATCYNSIYETIWTTRGQTTMSGNVYDTTDITKQSLFQDTIKVVEQSLPRDATNVTEQSLPHDTTMVLVQSSTLKVSKEPTPTELRDSLTSQNVANTQSPVSNENANVATVSSQVGISAGAIVAITIGILCVVGIIVLIIFCATKRRSSITKKKLHSFLNFSK